VRGRDRVGLHHGLLLSRECRARRAVGASMHDDGEPPLVDARAHVDVERER
jgi:hypothetical protein